MKALNHLDIFVRTSDNGSLSATARALDMTPAAASAALKRLEAELGVQLFVRSTRSLRLTPQGEQFLAQCRPALAALQQAGEQLAAGGQALRGVLKLSAPSDLGRNVLLPWLDDFQELHPDVDIRLQLADRMANVYSDPVDAALRYGKPPDSSLVALPLASANRRVLCASPGYLARHGTPATPHELSRHRCLCFMLGEEVHDRWRFRQDGDAPLTVRVRGANVSNDSDAVRRWAVLGRGIAYKSGLDVASDLAEGRLQALCTGWSTEAAPLFLVVPGRQQLTPLLRRLREFIAQRCAALGERIAHV
ncbi:LysR family transcriptional regulator [Comamonas endophytica]|uniref:LysR family transcriptional regulator n=1 Tax=Comamonas endophytica TaxID=2949090 RepID=A0ABY6GFX9_9BURK|nr:MULTISPECIES: LysR family transcriptional regulator [unclassified Acidovorax]MCD2514464.1 LysR family transcriptional regulator [Acidovorax sp. D4N7]UYG53753.1 LysR family transcriptional regulator [Acidovorax sp. 5MLIR]